MINPLPSLHNATRSDHESILVRKDWADFEHEIHSNELIHKMISSIFSESLYEVNAFKAIRDASGRIIDFEWILARNVNAVPSPVKESNWIGKRMREVSPEMYDELFSVYCKVVESGIPEHLEKVFVNKGQAPKWIHITIAKLEDGFVTTFKDVTSEKNQQTQLIERERLLKEAESLAKMGSWKWSEGDHELKWSDGLYDLLHKSADRPVSWNSFLEDVIPVDIQLVENCLHEVKTNRNGSSINYRVLKNGQLRYFSLTVKPHSVLDIDILGTVADITEHKLNEQQLEQFSRNQTRIIQELDEKEKRYRTLFERSIDPIFLATDELILLNVNNSFLNFTGYAGIEGSNVPLKTIFANGSDYELFKTKLAVSGQIRDFEVYLLTNAGDRKYCLMNCIFIADPVKENCCYQGIIHDLTLRKQAESDMLIAERLALTGKIARTIAHEVRNPLTNINLSLDQLREEIPAATPSAQLFCNIIERNANRIEELMSEMLNSSKTKKLNLGMVSVTEVLNATLRLAQDRINLSQIQLRTNYPNNLPRVLIDQEKIQIALLNIMINAIEAMTPGVGLLEINAVVLDAVVAVEIADNGKGIPPGDLKKLFDPFFTHKSTGIGLGLTSTKNILNSHNIAIDVRSVEEKGTSFYINFKTPE